MDPRHYIIDPRDTGKPKGVGYAVPLKDDQQSERACSYGTIPARVIVYLVERKWGRAREERYRCDLELCGMEDEGR